MEDVKTAVVPGPLSDLVLVKAPVRPTAAMIEAANEKADARGQLRQGPEQVWRDMMAAWLAAAPAPLPGGLEDVAPAVKRLQYVADGCDVFEAYRKAGFIYPGDTFRGDLRAILALLGSRPPSPVVPTEQAEGAVVGFLGRLDALHGELAMFGANMRRDASDERSDSLVPYAESVKHFAGVLSEIIMDMAPEEGAPTPASVSPCTEGGQ